MRLKATNRDKQTKSDRLVEFVVRNFVAPKLKYSIMNNVSFEELQH